jgi:uncharacterized protein YxeA
MRKEEYISHTDELKQVTERLNFLLRDSMKNYEEHAWDGDGDEENIKFMSYWKERILYYTKILAKIYD